MGKVLSLQDAVKDLTAARKGRKLVFTNGCFDILHVGHVRYLQEARAQGDLLFIGVNSDESVRRLKGAERPIQNEIERAEILAALGCVDYAVIFTEDTPAKIIEAVRPDVLVKGGDWAVKDIVGGEFVQSYGGAVRSLKFVPGRSTTGIVQKIMKL